jgi:hypothetical protein
MLTPDQAADLVAELDDDDFERRVERLCLGPVADGSRSLSEVAHELHGFAVFLVELEQEGWQLVHEAEDGHLHLINADATQRLDGPVLNES